MIILIGFYIFKSKDTAHTIGIGIAPVTRIETTAIQVMPVIAGAALNRA